MVVSQGYPFESHAVLTEDGYILTAWRIRHGRKSCMTKTGPPVFLQHGLLDYGYTWFFENTPEKSLAYKMADYGYDVWIGNSRGAKYSRNSIKYGTNPGIESDFWQFSWDEMASYDVPAHLRYVTNYTGYQKVHWVGHSQGTTQMFAGFLDNPEIQDLVASFSALGPVLNVGHITAKFDRFLADIHLAEVLDTIGLDVFINPPLMNTIGVPFCRAIPKACKAVADLIVGHGSDIDLEKMQVMGGHELGGTSMQNLHHWLKNVRDNKCQKNDYGKDENMKRYGQATPPLYPTDKLVDFKIPIYLIRGQYDDLADAEDVKLLQGWLPKDTVKTLIIPGYGHLGYVWAVDAADKVFGEVATFIRDNTHNSEDLHICHEESVFGFLGFE
eukprot:CAMPEP_0115015736 /NCGR_PEP_ID=MMETSP0216-20121206/26966_1 /TAXON_ID=223996 /ORGANISM="Protocruzia adherens, Strain Boccale" /LENGTH=384 /DNA_ID=CAMNT_0002385953 /DNA_START=140 /DNA_END=1294 /DNA_ORIENTATION=+